MVVFSGTVMEQQRIADLEQQLHHAESAALAVEKRAALLDARRNEARAIELGSIRKPAGFDGQASGFRNFRFPPRSEVPILTGSKRQGEGVDSSTTCLCSRALVERWRSWRTCLMVKGTRPGRGYITAAVLDCPGQAQGCTLTS